MGSPLCSPARDTALRTHHRVTQTRSSLFIHSPSLFGSRLLYTAPSSLPPPHRRSLHPSLHRLDLTQQQHLPPSRPPPSHSPQSKAPTLSSTRQTAKPAFHLVTPSPLAYHPLIQQQASRPPVQLPCSLLDLQSLRSHLPISLRSLPPRSPI